MPPRDNIGSGVSTPLYKINKLLTHSISRDSPHFLQSISKDACFSTQAIVQTKEFIVTLIRATLVVKPLVHSVSSNSMFSLYQGQ